MNERKMDVICKLNNIASAVCKMKDEKKFKKIETHVKKLNSTVERKKTVRKSSRKKKTMSKSMSMSHLSEPDLDTSKYDSIDNTNLPGTAPSMASSPSNDFLEPSRDRKINSEPELVEAPVSEPSELSEPSEPYEPSELVLPAPEQEPPEPSVPEPSVPEPSVPESSDPEPSVPEPLKGGSLSRRFY